MIILMACPQILNHIVDPLLLLPQNPKKSKLYSVFYFLNLEGA